MHLPLPTSISTSTSNSKKWVRSILHPSPHAIAIILGPLSSTPYDSMMEHIGQMYYRSITATTTTTDGSSSSKSTKNNSNNNNTMTTTNTTTQHHQRQQQQQQQQQCNNNYYYNCSVILASSPPHKFMLFHPKYLRSVAQEVLAHTSLALQQQQQQQNQPVPQQQIPIIIHSFSNGGAFLLEAIELELSAIVNDSSNNKNNNIAMSTTQMIPSSLINDEMYTPIIRGLHKGYQFYDSCPCYIRTLWDFKYFKQSFPHPTLPSPLRYIYTFGSAFALSIWCIFTCAWYRPHQFWNRRCCSSSRSIFSNNSRQIYMYTTTDLLNDAAAIDRLILDRRRITSISSTHPHQQFNENKNNNITVYRYNDSNHCQLHIDHPMEYQQAIYDALSSVIHIHDVPTTTTSTSTTPNE